MRALIVAAMLLVGCATVNPYAYTGMTRAECESTCSSYGYPILSFDQDGCQCNTFQCSRPRHRGGCEKLPARQVPLAPASQM